ncbi:probable WRKY transcription factor 4 isoform X2 [Asparagus officinalis]|uniref:probable WRKY transcription factor 4 isoform X2 n=1 Tax=Asparagus officinalis TaxID=4686 RepID=UPI00098E22F5|nr:probable WRKY transcription factor 4 isoform X2 [Asparagus officinalis]
METAAFAIAMTHQAVLATVTAQAHMQLQAAYPPSSEALVSPSHSASVDPEPLQQKPPSVPENDVSTPETVRPPPSEQKSQSTQIKTSSYDGYNWRKYGQKQVKGGDRSRSYYRCTNINCSAKKKVERCPDGQETEIIYRGEHNHDPPQKMKSMEEKGVQSVGPSGENETLDLPSSQVYESEPLTSKADHNSGNGTPERQLFCSSDCEGDAAVNTEEENANEPYPKRRLIETQSIVPYSAPVLKMIKEPKIVVHSAFDAAHIGDGYRWRKYGQKIVKGNPNPRSYYRCTHSGCPVRKHVERASDDAKAVVITYEGNHNHDQPPIKCGSDQRNPAATSVTKDVQSRTSDSSVDNKPPTETNKEFSGDKASELGEEKALDSAQTLLSIGCNSTSGEKASGTNSDGVNRSLFSENCSAVPVQNS